MMAKWHIRGSCCSLVESLWEMNRNGTVFGKFGSLARSLMGREPAQEICEGSHV
jgi:hypothetical protein